MGTTKLLIAGDLVPTVSNYKVFETGMLEELLGRKLAALWDNVDARIANLEAPIIDNGKPISKSGPNLSIPASCIKGFQTLNMTLFGLANNHIMDYGEDGLKSTVNMLEKNGIAYCGAGRNNRVAEKGVLLHVNGISVGIYACSEHEFSAAEKNQAGANAISINTCLRISELKRKSKCVIVLFHGGKEHYRYPTPEQQERCRYFVDAGADIVICQHSHCVGCEEKYNNATIVYGQGNFIFDYKNEECWKTGILIEVDIGTGECTDVKVQYHPIRKRENVVCYADQANEIMKQYYERSRKVDQIDKLYAEEAEREGPFLTRRLLGWNRVLRGIDRFAFRNRLVKHYVKKNSLTMLGVLRCETNKEIADYYLKEHK